MDELTSWYLREVATPEAVRAEALLQDYCDAHLEAVFERLELGRRLERQRTARELAAELGFVEDADVALEAMLRRLARRGGRLEEVAAEPPRFRLATKPEAGTGRPEAIRREMAALDPRYLAALDFLDYGAEHFEEALGEEPDLLDRMLSGRAKDPAVAELWHRATNADPLQDCHGRFGARALLELFAGGRVLEIGGGTGNGLRHVLESFEAEGTLDRIEEYVFTDVSVGFVNTTRREMKKRFPGTPLRWQFLDLNRPLEEQKVERASVEVIYAVNAAHVARDLVAFLASCRRALRPGGRVLFSERLRRRPGEMAPRELTLNLSPYHRGAAERSDYRPDHCYLTAEGWLEAFARADLEEGRILPDLERVRERFPGAYAAVTTAVRAEGEGA